MKLKLASWRCHDVLLSAMATVSHPRLSRAEEDEAALKGGRTLQEPQEQVPAHWPEQQVLQVLMVIKRRKVSKGPRGWGLETT